MSKNFELMQHLGKEHEMFQTATATATATATELIREGLLGTDRLGVEPLASESRQPMEIKPLELKMEDSQRDEIFKLVQRVFFSPGSEGSHLVVVSGTESGNGCSWICARMAEVLAAQVSATVCVVDANLRSPGLHREFGVTNHYGLTNALQTPGPVRGFVSQLSRPNLWLLSCGAESKDAQALLGSDRMRSLLPELRREFDYVLIDAPPLRGGDDTVILGRNAEGVVLVLRANTSRRGTARQAVQALEAANVRVLGAVLNHRTFPVPEAIYKKL
jgi:capsular exopolysaccharide synthesis family protein